MNTADWKKPQPQPTGKFSANVTPFKFGERLHRETMRRLNRHGNAQNARVKTHRDSRAVLWDGKPFYWSPKGHYRGGCIGQRRALHWLIWEKANGRRVPTSPRTVVVFIDGNKHNFSPDNLALRTKAQIAMANQRKLSPEVRGQARAKGWQKIGRAHLNSYLKSFNSGESTLAQTLRRKS